MQTLFEHISSIAVDDPQRIALLRCGIEGDIEERITFSELKRKLEKYATWLLELGLNSDDSIALAMNNSPEFIIMSWAAWSIGVITVPLDLKKGTLDDHLYKIKVSSSKIVVAKQGVFSEIEKNKLGKKRIVELENLKVNNISSNLIWSKNLTKTALILFTSGTTSKPKAAELSLKNILTNADSIKKWFKINSDDRFMVLLPMHHINSTSFCMATLLGGGSIAVIPTYSNSRFWQQSANSGSTFSSIVPSICFDQLSRMKEFDLYKSKIKIRKIQIGSAPVVVSDVKRFINMFGIFLYQGYGQTETALRVTGIPLDLDDKTYKMLIDTNSIGKPMDWARVEILDENGNALGENKEGELAVKGDAVMKGYLGQKNTFKEGFFLTGDVGMYKVINNEKYYFIKGRKKEIIIKGGVNISPVAVEDHLKRISEDIDQVFVVGISDRRFGEEIVAVIIWKKVNVEKAKTILKFKLVEGNDNISLYETPKYITSINVKELPTTSTGKVQRSVLQNKISFKNLEKVNEIMYSTSHSFTLLFSDRISLQKAHELYNHSWDPLTLRFDQFKDLFSNTSTIAAVNKNRGIDGIVTFMRVDFTEKELGTMTYKDFSSQKGKSILKSKGDSLVCISICGPNYKKEPIPNVKNIPSTTSVAEYLNSGKDGVYNFHLKAKGGFDEGARLIKIMPNSRQEDKRSLGYNMLLKYPEINRDVKLRKDASVATNLIESVMLVARNLGIKKVYAFSRPSGLSKYFSKN